MEVVLFVAGYVNHTCNSLLGPDFYDSCNLYLQEPWLFTGKDGFRDAFLRSITEYNQYGLAAGNAKFQIGSEAAVQLFGFKAAQ